MWPAEREVMVSPLSLCVAACEIVRRLSWNPSQDSLVADEDVKKPWKWKKKQATETTEIMDIPILCEGQAKKTKYWFFVVPQISVESFHVYVK